MRLLVPATIDPVEVHIALGSYAERMATHCPFLGPSIGRGLTTWCGYEADAGDQAELLALLVETAEDVRRKRRVGGSLVCANIVVFGPRDIPTAKKVVDWPHWITRNLYAPVRLMIGKFWIGEEENDKYGRPIAPPPISFLSVRHSYAEKDSRFLADLPKVSAALAHADDDGRDVLMPWLGMALSGEAVRAKYADLVAVFPSEKKVVTA